MHGQVGADDGQVGERVGWGQGGRMAGGDGAGGCGWQPGARGLHGPAQDAAAWGVAGGSALVGGGWDRQAVGRVREGRCWIPELICGKSELVVEGHWRSERGHWSCGQRRDVGLALEILLLRDGIGTAEGIGDSGVIVVVLDDVYLAPGGMGAFL